MPDPPPLPPLDCPSRTLCRTTWGRSEELQIGCLRGRVAESGWKWRIRSAESLWLWLNVAGEGLLWGPRERFLLKPGMFAMSGGGAEGLWTFIRHPGAHRVDWVEIPRPWLKQRVGAETSSLRGGLAGWLGSGTAVAFCGLMGVWERDLSESLEKAGQGTGPARFMAEARVLEWAAERIFQPTAALSATAAFGRATGADAVKRAVQLLQERMDQPLDLAWIAKTVGVSPHHLSRRVSGETGMTLQQHLRRLRISHACELLASGRMNVTEAALEVGYQSLSHFAKAFREETGQSPRAWLASRQNG